MAFIDAFRLLALMFLVIAPLGLLMGRPPSGKHGAAPGEA